MNRTQKPHFIYIHILYWVFYVIFFTLQRFAFYGYKNFFPVFALQLTYLPGVFMFTYFLSEVMVPQYYHKRKPRFLLIILFIILFIYPTFVFFERKYIVEPYVFNDQITYSLYNFFTAILIFVFGAVPIIGLKVGQLFRNEWIQQETIKKEKLEADYKLRLTELKLLRGQIQPHFLFNALNSIQILIYENPRHAARMITELSEFLRFTYRDKDKLYIPLAEEVEIVRKYLSMEKTRFPERLVYSIEVSKEASRKEVITFLLQPFVENAIKHGMKTSPEPLSINVRGYIKQNILFLEVSNSGRWIENSNDSGTGITNAYERLQNAYPQKYNIQISKNPNNVCVIIEIIL
jgi:LytS/YehU family sensor histidine kinase